MKLEHIGIAVKSLEQATAVFKKIFETEASEVEIVEEQKTKVVKFRLENCDIELLEGTSPDSPVSNFIEKKGEGIHHLSFSVEDVAASLKKMESKGIRLVNTTPTTGADNMKVGFLHPKSTNNILLELTEKQRTSE